MAFFGITVNFIIQKLRIWQIPFPDLERSLKAAHSLIKSFLDSDQIKSYQFSELVLHPLTSN